MDVWNEPKSNFSYSDRLRNDSIRNKLEIFNHNTIINEIRINWRERLYRMENERISVKATNYKCTGRRNVGRPQKQWVPSGPIRGETSLSRLKNFTK